jgi:FKBP-type peptidyl-prolyl cis-trans isomerase FkpA
MKKYIAVFCFTALSSLAFCRAVPEDVTRADERTKTSYAFGRVVGADLGRTGLEFDYDAFTNGFRDSVTGAESPFTLDEAVGMVQAAFEEIVARRAEENRAKEAAFLAENAEKDTVRVTESGLQYEVVSEGTGTKPLGTDTVRVHYEGSLIDGAVFDSSFSRGEPVEFPLDRVIPGWSEGLQLMPVGSVYRFYIPSRIAYGEQGMGQVIPPYATLIFRVELLGIVAPESEDFPGGVSGGAGAPAGIE